MQSTQTDRSEQIEHSKKLACITAKIANEYRGKDTIVLDTTAITPIFDFMILTTATSRRQMHAIAEEVDRVLKDEGSRRIGREGYESSAWILQDYGDLLLHVLSPEARDLYELERLWGDASRVDWHAHLEQL